MTTQLWIPSDDLVALDPIAQMKMASAFQPPDLEAHRIKLFDIEDDDANEAAACVVLASLDRDDIAGDEPGEADDDDQIDDDDDVGDV